MRIAQLAQLTLAVAMTSVFVSSALADGELVPEVVGVPHAALANEEARQAALEPPARQELMPAGVKIIAVESLAAEEPKHFYEEELIEVLKSVGFAGPALKEAWAVAMKESTGNPNAHNQNANTGDNSYGLFQINMIGRLGPARVEKYGLDSYEDLFDPYVNASIAFQMSKEGTNWGPWGIGPDAYNGGTTGSYYKWLDEYPGG
jgi:hypothetical protein